MSRLIGKYTFPVPKPLSDAKPPRKRSGVYALLTKPTDGSSGTVRYIGSSCNLADRINWGHEKAKQLLDEVGRDPEKVLATWIEVPAKRDYFRIEEELIAHFGFRVTNSNKKAK